MVFHEFISNSLPSGSNEDANEFGFGDYEIIESNKLIELDGSIVEYYDFGEFLVIPNGENGQRARMIADKKVDVYLHDGDLGILDFVFYSNKLKESK